MSSSSMLDVEITKENKWNIKKEKTAFLKKKKNLLTLLYALGKAQ